MKHILKFLFAFFLFSATSCNAQKLVKTSFDAKKLQDNKEQFIGKPLKTLLAQIKPEIKFAYGNPDNKWEGTTGGTYIKFFFIDREEHRKKFSQNEKPIGITVRLQLEPNNTRKPIPKEGLSTWGKEQTEEYGDMIIVGVYVSGEN